MRQRDGENEMTTKRVLKNTDTEYEISVTQYFPYDDGYYQGEMAVETKKYYYQTGNYWRCTATKVRNGQIVNSNDFPVDPADVAAERAN